MSAQPMGYPRLLRRIQGAAIDGVIIPVAAILTLITLAYTGVGDGRIKAAIATLVILALEPGAVSFTGGTIGHHIVGIRVRRLGSDVHLGLVPATFRFLVKVFFGTPAFFIALLTRRRQALHDLAARSIVVYKSTTGLPDHEFLYDLDRDEEQRAFASVGRRVAVIAVYWFLALLVWEITAFLALSKTCVMHEICTDLDEGLTWGTFGAFLLAIVSIAVLGWRGLLYGCRKQPIRVVEP
jgi:uncharacterized RDD family membrane protein YckC